MSKIPSPESQKEEDIPPKDNIEEAILAPEDFSEEKNSSESIVSPPEEQVSPEPVQIIDQTIESLSIPNSKVPLIFINCTIFSIDWKEQEIDTPISFVNCNFQQRFNLSQTHFHQPLIIRSGRFSCPVQIQHCHFHYKTPIDSIDKIDTAEEISNIIHPDLGFIEGVIFMRGASFTHCHFYGQVDFSRAQFQSNISTCSFEHSVFHYPFRRIKTPKNTHLPQFIRMPGITFHRDLCFRNVTVASGIDFYESTVQGRANFSNSTFQAPVFLNYTTFHKDVTFAKATFNSYFSSHNAHFHKALIWESAIFKQRLKCDYLTVDGRFNANDCQFFIDNHPSKTSKPSFYKIIFSNARFGNIVDFRGSIFGGIVHFRRAHFEEEVRLQKTEFNYYTSFENARFDDTLIIQDISNCLGKQASLHFSGARLEKISASHLELESFLHCLFPEIFQQHLEKNFEDKKYYHSINLISQKDFDEAQLELQDPEATRLREATNTLAEFNKSFHDSFNNKGEDWCYLQLKKLQRKSLTKRPILWFGSWLLDITCGYGTSPYRVSLTAFFFLFLFAGIYIAIPTAFNPAGELAASYLSADGTQLVSVPFGEALTLSFQVLTSSEVVPHIEPKQQINGLIMLESFIGYIVMMLLVITLSRKVIRS